MPGLLIVLDPSSGEGLNDVFDRGLNGLYRRPWHQIVFDSEDTGLWYRVAVLEDPSLDLIRVDRESAEGLRLGLFDIVGQAGAFDGVPDSGGFVRCFFADPSRSFRVECDPWGQYRLYYRSVGSKLVITTDPCLVLGFDQGDNHRSAENWMRNAAIGGVINGGGLSEPWRMVPPRTALASGSEGGVSEVSFSDGWIGNDVARPLESEDELNARLVDCFRQTSQGIVDAHGERLGLSLTGGVDSRMAAAGLWATGSRPTSYCFGSEYGRSRDERVAAEIASAIGCPLEVVRLDAGFRDRFWSLAKECVRATGGLLDVSGAAEIYVNEQARQWGAVRVTGNYGGELYRNLIAMGPTGFVGRGFVREMQGFARDAVEGFRALDLSRPSAFIADIQMPVGHYARRVAERSQLLAVSPFVSLGALRAHRSFGAPVCHRAEFLRWARALFADTPLSSIDRHNVRQDDSGTLRLSSRFWDKLTFKFEYYVDYGMPSAVASALAALRLSNVDRWFLGRHKFYHFNRWYRNELKGVVGDVLLDPQFLNLSEIDRNAVNRLVEEHHSGRRNHTLEIHGLLGFAAFRGI